MPAEPTSTQPDPPPELRSRSAPIIERAPLPTLEVEGSAHLVSYVNAAFCRLLGKTRRELIGKPFAEIVHRGEECVPLLDKVFQTGEAVTYAQQENSEPDSAHWLYAMWPALDPNECPVGVIIQLAKAADFRQDATAINEALLIAGLRQHELTDEAEKLNALLQAEVAERKQAEVIGVYQKQLLEALSESVLDGILIVSPEGRMIHFNQHFLEIWKFPPEVIQSHSDEAALQWAAGQTADPAAFLAGVTSAYQNPNQQIREELLMKDGRVYERCGAPARIGEARLGWVWTFRDITERQTAVENLRFAKEQAEAASRAKDDFLAALSHELRTPLTPVLMMAADLAGDPALPIEVRDQLAMMRRNIELEARLIDDLLDLTRISRGKLAIAPVPADVHQLIEHTAEIIRSDGLNKQVRIVFLLEAARHCVLADPARLQQVFWNLIKNALKFTPTGGTITVKTRNDAEDWIVVSVEDTGIGIGADALPNVFNAFEQGDIAGQHRYGGLGLGLAISQAIVAVHGGTISAESEGPGCGATFSVALATVAASAVPAHASMPRPAPGRSLRLLVVEDHEATLSVLTRLLTRSGHRIATATTMHEALTTFAAERFDAIISDLGLPDGSGLDLMREIQRQRPVPGIALSGYGMEDDLRQTKEAGFFAHLVKPVNLDQLRLLLDQLAVPMG